MKTIKLNSDELEKKIELPSVKAKNTEKLTLLSKIDLSKYKPELIKLLVDGDYNDKLHEHKVQCYMLINEILEKKILYTHFGVNTMLYKLCSSLKRKKTIEHFFNRHTKKPQTRQQTKIQEIHTDEVEDEDKEEDEDEVDEETFIQELLSIAQKSKQGALKLLNENLDKQDELYKLLYKKILLS